jgi:hypothetical protein
VTYLEALAVISGVKQFHTYLAGNQFEIHTDHVTLTFLRRMKIAENNRLARWALLLQPYQFTIHYKKGTELTLADAISRLDNLPPPAEEWEAEEDMVCATSSISGRMHIAFGPPTQETTDADAPYINCLTAQAQTDEQVDADNTNCREREIGLEKYTTLIWQCPDFSPMMYYLTTGKLLTNDDEARKIVLGTRNYIILDGALYHFHTPRTKNVARANAVIKQLCVPTTIRPEVARQLHDRNCHAGADRAYALARTKFYWPGMYAILRQRVLTCLRCHQSK